MKKTLIAAFALVALSFIVSLWVYPSLPASVASHWNAAGQANGYSDKLFGALFVPVLSLVLVVFFVFLPRIDPLRANYAKFQKYYDLFVLVFVAFMVYLHAITIYWNLGGAFSFTALLTPAFAALFYFIGVLMQNAKRNWFVGIRTPWTMSSDRVWDRTHAVGGKLFKACGIISLLGLVFSDAAIVFMVAPVISVAVFTFVFSYVEFKKEQKEKGKGRRKENSGKLSRRK
jgi:uncharacterized membrane protein